MTNIMTSDFYRLRKGAAARNTLIGLLGTVLFVSVIMLIFTSDAVLDFMTATAKNAPGQFVTVGDAAEMEMDIQELRDYVPDNAGGFGMEMASEGFLPFFFLPIIIAVFGADFSAGTYRNTLSYETNRSKVYLAKLALSVLCCLGLTAAMLLFSWLLGGLLFGGFAGAGALMGQTVIVILLQLPINLGIICFGHCMVAFTKKSGSTIAAYLLTLMLLSVVVQILGLLIPLSFVQLLDWNSVGKALAGYQTMATSEVLFAVIYGLVVAVATTALGLSRYKKTDMA